VAIDAATGKAAPNCFCGRLFKSSTSHQYRETNFSRKGTERVQKAFSTLVVVADFCSRVRRFRERRASSDFVTRSAEHAAETGAPWFRNAQITQGYVRGVYSSRQASASIIRLCF
jgi:hypothetical protein